MAEQTPQSNHAKGGAANITSLNDWLRGHLTAPGNNRVVMTSGIADLMGDVALFRNFHKREELLGTVRDFDVFDHATDPYGEHDLGRFQLKGTVEYRLLQSRPERRLEGSGRSLQSHARPDDHVRRRTMTHCPGTMAPGFPLPPKGWDH